jgi:hypothetical protein
MWPNRLAIESREPVRRQTRRLISQPAPARLPLTSSVSARLNVVRCTPFLSLRSSTTRSDAYCSLGWARPFSWTDPLFLCAFFIGLRGLSSSPFPVYCVKAWSLVFNRRRSDQSLAFSDESDDRLPRSSGILRDSVFTGSEAIVSGSKELRSRLVLATVEANWRWIETITENSGACQGEKTSSSFHRKLRIYNAVAGRRGCG